MAEVVKIEPQKVLLPGKAAKPVTFAVEFNEEIGAADLFVKPAPEKLVDFTFVPADQHKHYKADKDAGNKKKATVTLLLTGATGLMTLSFYRAVPDGGLDEFGVVAVEITYQVPAAVVPPAEVATDPTAKAPPTAMTPDLAGFFAGLGRKVDLLTADKEKKSWWPLSGWNTLKLIGALLVILYVWTWRAERQFPQFWLKQETAAEIAAKKRAELDAKLRTEGPKRLAFYVYWRYNPWYTVIVGRGRDVPAYLIWHTTVDGRKVCHARTVPQTFWSTFRNAKEGTLVQLPEGWQEWDSPPIDVAPLLAMSVAGRTTAAELTLPYDGKPRKYYVKRYFTMLPTTAGTPVVID